jgi:hypothetical protein
MKAYSEVWDFLVGESAYTEQFIVQKHGPLKASILFPPAQYDFAFT